MDELKVKKNEQEGIKYNNAAIWQIGFFALNNAATNIAMFVMGYYAFFTQNILGLAAVIVGAIATGMRVWDGVTDPLIGFLIDKTNGRLGKFRPFMIIGNIILFIMVNLIFRVPPEWTIKQKYLTTTGLYVVYIIGYTFQTAVTKGAQAALTNNPKQRPIFTMFDALYMTIIYSGGAFLITSVMAPCYPQNLIDPQLWKTVALVFMSLSLICTILAMIGIAEKDQTKYFGLGKNAVEVRFGDYLDIMKHNRPIQMLIIAASTDKLAITATRGATVYFFSNILLNYELQGQYSLANVIPVLIITTIGVNWSRKVGIKKAFVAATYGSMLALIVLTLTTTTLSKSLSGTMILLCIMAVQAGIAGISSNIVIPMIADCADYETYRSGRFIPGMMGTIFSFVDKLISSVATFIVGAVIAWAGYGNSIIETNTALNSKFSFGIIFCMFVIPIFGHIASIIAMKFYNLGADQMDIIKAEIEHRKGDTV